jgi:hypothetical protein
MSQIVLYQAVNRINGKRYIGATRQGLTKRAYGHYSVANKQPLGEAIREYGRENIVFSVLVVCPNYRYALDLETAYIKASNPEYNLIASGYWAGKKRPKETIDKIIATKKAAPKRTPTEKEQAARRQCIKIANLARLRAVVCISTGEIFDSMAEAAIKLRVPRTNIWFACHNPGRKVRGMEFCYAPSD